MLSKPSNYKYTKINSTFIRLIHFQFVMTLSERWYFYFMFITEVIVGGGILGCIILKGVPNIVPPYMYQLHKSRVYSRAVVLDCIRLHRCTSWCRCVYDAIAWPSDPGKIRIERSTSFYLPVQPVGLQLKLCILMKLIKTAGYTQEEGEHFWTVYASTVSFHVSVSCVCWENNSYIKG